LAFNNGFGDTIVVMIDSIHEEFEENFDSGLAKVKKMRGVTRGF
jgi:hypothetical protein